MDEDRALALIARLVQEMPALNAKDPWEARVLTTPVEMQDEDGQPTGEFMVHLGWHCWAVFHDEPEEYGLPVALLGDIPTKFAYQILKNSYAAMMDVRTFRTWEEARQ